jgi:anti-anti-sigma regulatory factor/HAMP domain-containing protein
MNTSQFFKKLNVSTKTNLVIGLLLGLMLLVIITLLNNYVGNLANQTGRRRVEQEAQVLQSQFNEVIQEILSTTKLLASTPGLVEAVADEDADKAGIIAVTNRAALKLDYINIVDINKVRVVVAPREREHLSVEQEDALFTLALLGIETTGALVANETPPTLYLVAVAPLRDTMGALVGAVLAGRDVNDELLTEINFAREDVYPLLIIDEQVIAHNTACTIEQHPAILLDETAIAQALNGQIFIADKLVSIENTPYAMGHIPLTINDETIAVMGILVNTESLSSFQQQLISNLSIIFAILTLVVVGTIAIIVRGMVTTPLSKLQTVAEQMADGNYEQHAETTAMDETGRLALAFNTMSHAIQEREERLRQEIIEREQAEMDRDRLQQEVIAAQQQAISELSSPIIPVVDMPDGSGSIIVMPLIGSIDTVRAQDIMHSLLAGISQYRAKVVILDITGVPLVDSGVANYLTQAIQAARLKGARIIVTGITDAVAESIVDLGIDWNDIETLRDLQTGLAVALSNLGVRLGTV